MGVQASIDRCRSLASAIRPDRRSAQVPWWNTTDGRSNGHIFRQPVTFDCFGNQWSPRPVLQSYSAYTKELSLQNAAHLLGERAPRNVLFNVQPIDNRLPSLEDGSSWPVLLANYLPSRISNQFVYLVKLNAEGAIRPTHCRSPQWISRLWRTSRPSRRDRTIVCPHRHQAHSARKLDFPCLQVYSVGDPSETCRWKREEVQIDCRDGEVGLCYFTFDRKFDGVRRAL